MRGDFKLMMELGKYVKPSAQERLERYAQLIKRIHGDKKCGDEIQK